jgi:hypothetical protein
MRFFELRNVVCSVLKIFISMCHAKSVHGDLHFYGQYSLQYLGITISRRDYFAINDAQE